MIHGENLAKELRRDHGFILVGRTRDGKAMVMRKHDKWTVVPLRWLTEDAMNTIKVQAGISLA